MPPPVTITRSDAERWKDAAAKVEEERGEPTGAKAQIDVPAELRHYSDRRRFLAVQVAELREQRFDLPRDYAGLAVLIEQHQLVEAPPVGDDYVLYGVGGSATEEPFSHFDPSSGKDVQLFATYEDFKSEDQRLSASLVSPRARAAELQTALRQAGRGERARRKALFGELADTQASITSIAEQRQLLESFYENAQRREALLSEYQSLARAAGSLSGVSYDLDNPASRRLLKTRLLSFIRPQALAILLDLASGYKAKFNRPMPVTSMVRPEQYQRQLAVKNPNAARISTPPHSTGLAFDIYDHYMTAAEQEHLMALIAQLKDDGRVEALRENRDHIHVFAFADGQRPDESLIARSLADVGPEAAPMLTSRKRAGSRKAARASPARHVGRRSS